jgi:hypothetical protein
MSDQTPGQRLLACFRGDPYLRGDHPESCGYCGSARAEPHQAECEWDAAREAASALAASEARCRALEGVEQSLELAEAAQFAAELRAAGAEARCRALQAQIEQQEAQK